jgi:hypothetical protein
VASRRAKLASKKRTRNNLAIGSAGDPNPVVPNSGNQVVPNEEILQKVQNATRITIRWPRSASSLLEAGKARILLFIDRHELFNPHLTIQLQWGGRHGAEGWFSNWRKWKPSDPTPAHWYSQERFKRLMAAHVSRDQDLGQSQTVREFVAQFRGLSGSLKRTQVVDEADISGRTTLAEFFTNGGTINRRRVAELHDAMIENSKTVKPTDIGVIVVSTFPPLLRYGVVRRERGALNRIAHARLFPARRRGRK